MLKGQSVLPFDFVDSSVLALTDVEVEGLERG
jgi:hypothetical protein